jgi:hypothetical protein
VKTIRFPLEGMLCDCVWRVMNWLLFPSKVYWWGMERVAGGKELANTVEKTASKFVLYRTSVFFFIDVIMYIFYMGVLSHRNMSTGSTTRSNDGEGSLSPTSQRRTLVRVGRAHPTLLCPAPASALEHFPIASLPHTPPST